MGQETKLTGSSASVDIAPGYTLRAPALHASVQELEADESASRSDSGRLEKPLLDALASAEIVELKAFEITTQSVEAAGAIGHRSDGLTTADGEAAMQLSVAAIDANLQHVVLHTDEAGVTRWIFPQVPGPSVNIGDEQEFLLPRDPAPLPLASDGDPASRGEFTKLGRRLVRVLAWATEDIVGKGALAMASVWEQKHRPYALRRFPSGDDRPIDWVAMGSGRALLLLHGTFSSAADAFALLPQPTSDALMRLYDSRIFAFDHPSLHRSPAENVQQLMRMLPPGTDLEVDVVTHSRGGLVARELIERSPGGAARLRVRRAIFVAAPQRGTVLADSEHGIEMLDRYTNLFTELPDDAFTIGIEALFMFAKLTYHGAVKGLPGLASMHPTGSYMDTLNRGVQHDAEYFAISSDFKPQGTSLLKRFGWSVADALVDGIFGEGNDGVVPTEGGYALRVAAPGFPIPDDKRLVFDHKDGVNHLNFFANERTGKALLDWLGQGSSLAACPTA